MMLLLSFHVLSVLVLLPTFCPTAANGLSIVSQPSSTEQLPFMANTSVALPVDNHFNGPMFQGEGAWRKVLLGEGKIRDTAKTWGYYFYVQLSEQGEGVDDPNSYRLVKAASNWKPDPIVLEADHIFESQILGKLIQKAGVTDANIFTSMLGTQVKPLQNLMNHKFNSMLISLEMNKLKAAIFKEVLKDINLDSNGDLVCTPLSFQPWRMYETLSALRYIAKTCYLSIDTANDVGKILEGYKGVVLNRDWLNIGAMFKGVLTKCLRMEIVPRQDDPTIVDCNFKLP